MTKTEKDETEIPKAEAASKREGSDDDSVSSEEEEDDLGLEGVLIRNPDASSSSSSEEEDDEEDQKMPVKNKDDNSKNDKDNNNTRKRPSSSPQQKQTKKRTKKTRQEGPEIINVEFTFHDFDEKFFHGVKSLLHESSPVYQLHASALTDLMIENISVGTVCSTEGDGVNVFGFASILNVTTYGDKPCIQYLKKICLDHCPAERKQEMQHVLSGKTARPAGFYFHGRMVNMPLEINEVLQQQLVLDMDWAVENAEGGEAERKSLDFGAFVRMAPAHMDGGALIYRFFDDEIFATNAEFVYNVPAPQSFGSEEKLMVSIIVLTKTGHRAAMKELKQMVGSTGNSS